MLGNSGEILSQHTELVNRKKAITSDNLVLYNHRATLHKLIDEQALKTPNHIALIFNNEKMTYRELKDKSDKVAGVLQQKGIRQDEIIGLVTKRSFSMVIGMIGILKAGAAYLPIDPLYPKERINFMMKDSGAKIILTNLFVNRLLDFGGDIFSIDNICNSGEYVHLKEVGDATDLAYVIYTSGSTGTPKGVMIEHGAVINFIKGIIDIIDFTEGKTILASTTISFDISVLEILLPLTRGMRIVIVDENEQKNPKLLCELIKTGDIDMLQITPSGIQLLFNHEKDFNYLKSVKEIMVGGEVFPERLLEKIRASSRAKIYNMYGPTETTVWSTISDLTDKDNVDIGKPIINTQIYILDENKNLLSNGTEGELYIGGKGLARGYLNRLELTAERFIMNPLIRNQKIYKTGDLVKLLPDGNIEYIGRIDNQVKIRGHRVELGEIESNLEKYKSIRQAVVTLKEGKENFKYLCAYYVSPEELLISDLRNYMSAVLPDYMVPTYFVRVDCFPQTPNGKIDRLSLPDPNNLNNLNADNIKQDYTNLSTTNIEMRIKKVILEIINVSLPVDSLDINESLTNLGIDSIIFVTIAIKLETELEFEFGDEDLNVNKFSTLESLITYIERRLNNRKSV